MAAASHVNERGAISDSIDSVHLLEKANIQIYYKIINLKNILRKETEAVENSPSRDNTDVSRRVVIIKKEIESLRSQRKDLISRIESVIQKANEDMNGKNIKTFEELLLMDFRKRP